METSVPEGGRADLKLDSPAHLQDESMRSFYLCSSVEFGLMEQRQNSDWRRVLKGFIHLYTDGYLEHFI